MASILAINRFSMYIKVWIGLDRGSRTHLGSACINRTYNLDMESPDYCAAISSLEGNTGLPTLRLGQPVYPTSSELMGVPPSGRAGTIVRGFL